MNEDYTDFIEASGLLKYDPEIISKIYQKKALQTYVDSFFRTRVIFKRPNSI